MIIRCMDGHNSWKFDGTPAQCTKAATERLGWYDEDDILWYSFLCGVHANDSVQPDSRDRNVPHTEAVS